MNTNVLAIDPGTSSSAYVLWEHSRIIEARMLKNEEMLYMARYGGSLGKYRVAIEMIACYGMPVGKEVFETCLFIGRLLEAFWKNGFDAELVYCKDVRLHHCLSPRAKDSNIRQALIDKYGKPGTKKSPGPTYGITSHLWAALAIAAYITEREICSNKA